MIEKLDELKRVADVAELDPGTDERMDTHEHFEFVYAVARAYPLLRSVIETAAEISKMYTEEALGLHYPGDTWEEVKSELDAALAALNGG